MFNAINPKKLDILIVLASHIVIFAIILGVLIYCQTITMSHGELLWSWVVSLFVVVIFIFMSYKVLQDISQNAFLFLILLGVDLLLMIAGNGYFLTAAGISIAGQSAVSHNSMNGLYLSAMTFTTVGYGDVTPAPGIGRLIAATEALTSYVLLALFIANIIELAKRPKPNNKS